MRKHFLKLLTILLIFSCNKSKIQPIDQDVSKNTDKKTRAFPLCTLLLIPAGYTERVGFICDGYVYPTQSLLTNFNIITGVDDSPLPWSPYYFDILNPSGFGNLPTLIPGPTLTGIALAELPSYNYPAIYPSYTNSISHYLFKAKKVGNDYEIVSSIILNSPFATANNGWVLHDIELSNNGKLYGLFSNLSTNNTIVTEINPTSGICNQYITLPAMRCAGMDIQLNQMYILLYEDITATTYGKILTYQLGAASYGTLNLSIPSSNPSYTYNLNWGVSGYDHDFFLSFVPGTANNFTIYNKGNTVANLYKYDISMPGTPASTASNTALWYDITSNTFSSSIIGYLITDAAN
ncbi:MAG: hypothetical protein IPG85_14225 [Bacteroidetes bacterium]|nr:hypothetical protein [Bacteroidota bacterium]